MLVADESFCRVAAVVVESCEEVLSGVVFPFPVKGVVLEWLS